MYTIWRHMPLCSVVLLFKTYWRSCLQMMVLLRSAAFTQIVSLLFIHTQAFNIHFIVPVHFLLQLFYFFSIYFLFCMYTAILSLISKNSFIYMYIQCTFFVTKCNIRSSKCTSNIQITIRNTSKLLCGQNVNLHIYKCLWKHSPLSELFHWHEITCIQTPMDARPSNNLQVQQIIFLK